MVHHEIDNKFYYHKGGPRNWLLLILVRNFHFSYKNKKEIFVRLHYFFSQKKKRKVKSIKNSEKKNILVSQENSHKNHSMRRLFDRIEREL